YNHNTLDKNVPTTQHQKTKKLKAIPYPSEHVLPLYSHEQEPDNLLLHNIFYHFLQSQENILPAEKKYAQSDEITLNYLTKKSLALHSCQRYNPHSTPERNPHSKSLEDLGGLRHSLIE